MKFRSTLGGGYKKEDVNAYIASMQAEFTGIEETLKHTIDHQKQEMDEMRTGAAEAQSLREALDAVTEQRDALVGELAELKNSLLAEKQAHAEVVSKLSDAVAKQTAAEAQCAEMKEQAESTAAAEPATADAAPAVTYPEDYEALKLKAEQYDRMSSHVGAIMLKANANAEDLVQRAREEAETMLSGVNAELSEARSKAQTAADTIIDGIHNRVADISGSCHDDILVDLEEIRLALTTMMDAVQDKYTEIEKKIGYAKDEMNAAAKEIINRNTAQRVLKK